MPRDTGSEAEGDTEPGVLCARLLLEESEALSCEVRNFFLEWERTRKATAGSSSCSSRSSC